MLSWKSADIYEYDDGEQDDDIPSEDELRRRSEELGIVALDPLRRDARNATLTALGVDTTSTTAEKSVEVERKSDQPLRIASFPC